MGVGLCFWMKQVHDSGGAVGEVMFVLPPMLILQGASQTMFPQLQFSNKDLPNIPKHLVAIRMLLIVIGVAIGLALRFTVLKDWKSDLR